MALTRKQLAQLYRPVGPKLISGGNAWASGGSLNLVQQVDLSLPIRGLRFEVTGRLVVGTAGFGTVNPEGFLNMIPRIQISGTNSRQNGNVSLLDMDMATLFVIQHFTNPQREAHYDINSTEVVVPSTPLFPTAANPTATTGTYDFRIVVDVPFAPFGCETVAQVGFLARKQEWKDSLAIFLNYGTQAGAGATGFLGVAAGGTTVTFTAYGSGSGSPQVNIYSLPMIMGLDIDNGQASAFTPGFCTRVSQPISTILQSAGTGVTLLNLQKQPTSKIYGKIGVVVASPTFNAFSSVSDTNLSQIGVTLGGNRQVRNKLSLFAHKQSVIEQYGHDPIQGHFLLDFLQSGNPDSAYPGDKIGDGATFQLVGDVAGVANAGGLIIQEQVLYRPEGALYLAG